MIYVSLHENMRQAIFYSKEFAKNNVANVKRVRMNTCPIEIDLKDGNKQLFMPGPVFETWERGRHNYELGQAKTTRNEDVLTVCFDKHPEGRDKTILMVSRRWIFC